MHNKRINNIALISYMFIMCIQNNVLFCQNMLEEFHAIATTKSY
jgi:hypothetical protein